MRLKPGYKNYIWGGRRLIEEYHKDFDGDVLAESWELSCYPDTPSAIDSGRYAGLTLPEYIKKEGLAVLGTDCRNFRDFPVLIKLIDAKENLSIQVHPDNEYAWKNEGQFGKTEMWYIMEADEGAFLYYGFEHEVSREEFERRIRDNTLTEILHAVPVRKGDVFFIAAGTLHAIGKGIMVAEIQQNSNVTYRIFDYGRVGRDGKPRQLHIEKALEVTKRCPVPPLKSPEPHIAKCDYFTVDKIYLDGEHLENLRGYVGAESFACFLFTDGEGTIRCHDESLIFRKGESFFLPAGSGEYEICGKCQALLTTV